MAPRTKFLTLPGRSHGLLRFRCKSLRAHVQRADQDAHGASAQEGPLARSRQSDDRRHGLAKTAALCGVHPTTAFRWRHRFLRAPASDKPRSLRGIVEADETFILEIFKGRWSDLPRKARKRGGKADMPAFIRTTFPFSSPATGKARPSTRSCLRSTALRWERRSPGSSRRAIISSAMAARRSPLSPAEPGSASTRASAGKADPEAPHLHINNVNAYHGRLKQWLNRFNGVATKNLPNYLGWRRALEAWGGQLAPQAWIKGAIGNGPYQQLTP